jgi:hypothetical protein
LLPPLQPFIFFVCAVDPPYLRPEIAGKGVHMGKTAKIITGLGVLAGISYLGRRNMTTEKLAAQGGGFFGYVKGMGQGFVSGIRTALRFR